jgi:hypothetical protein
MRLNMTVINGVKVKRTRIHTVPISAIVAESCRQQQDGPANGCNQQDNTKIIADDNRMLQQDGSGQITEDAA